MSHPVGGMRTQKVKLNFSQTKAPQCRFSDLGEFTAERSLSQRFIICSRCMDVYKILVNVNVKILNEKMVATS